MFTKFKHNNNVFIYKGFIFKILLHFNYQPQRNQQNKVKEFTEQEKNYRL